MRAIAYKVLDYRHPVTDRWGSVSTVFVTKWAELSSLAGLRPIILIKNLFGKLFWLGVFLISTAVCCWQVNKLFDGYMHQRLGIKLKIENHGSVAFPAVTVCNLNAYRRSAAAKVPELGTLMLAYEAAATTLGSTDIHTITNRKRRKRTAANVEHAKDKKVRTQPNRSKRDVNDISQQCIQVNGIYVDALRRCYVGQNVNQSPLRNWTSAADHCKATFANQTAGIYGRLATFSNQETWNIVASYFHDSLIPTIPEMWLGIRALCGEERWRLFWMDSATRAGQRVDETWPQTDSGWGVGVGFMSAPAVGAFTRYGYFRYNDKSIQFDIDTNVRECACEFGFEADLPAPRFDSESICGSTTVSCNKFYAPGYFYYPYVTSPCNYYFFYVSMQGWLSTWCVGGTIYDGDFDGDYQCDLMCNNYPNPVEYLFGSKTTGYFDYSRNRTGPPLNFCTTAQPGAGVATDINGDGIYDLVCRYEQVKGFETLLNPGLGTLDTPDWSSGSYYRDDVVYCPAPGRLTFGFADCTDNVIDLRCEAQNSTACSIVYGLPTSANHSWFPTIKSAVRCSADCPANYCFNNAQCAYLDNEPVCYCAAGWEGTHCETNVDDCASVPCKNGATCIDDFQAVTCICAFDYFGPFCQYNNNSCASASCLPGYICLDYIGGYTCVSNSNTSLLAKGLLYSDTQANSLSLQAVTLDAVGYLVGTADRRTLADIGHQQWQMVEHCVYDGIECSSHNIRQSWDVNYGNCFTFNGDAGNVLNTSRAGADFGLFLILSATTNEYMNYTPTAGIKMIVHSQEEFPFPDSGTNVALNAASYYKLHRTIIKRLNSRTSSCISSMDRVDKFYYTGNYTIEGCYRSCQQDAVLKVCGCGDPQFPLPPSNDSWTYCRLDKRLCINYAEAEFEKYITKDCQHCLPPCSESTWDLTQSISKYTSLNFQPLECMNSPDKSCIRNYSKQRAYIKIYYSRLVTTTMEEFVYNSWFQLVTDVGNAIGFWIGASMLSLIEILFLIYGILSNVRVRLR